MENTDYMPSLCLSYYLYYEYMALAKKTSVLREAVIICWTAVKLCPADYADIFWSHVKATVCSWLSIRNIRLNEDIHTHTHTYQWGGLAGRLKSPNNMYIYIYTYICISLSLSLSLSVYIYIYINMGGT